VEFTGCSHADEVGEPEEVLPEAAVFSFFAVGVMPEGSDGFGAGEDHYLVFRWCFEFECYWW